MVWLSHPYMTTGKTIALNTWTFAGKVMSLLLNMLSRFVIAFLPRSKQASFNFMVTVTICSDFGAQENKICQFFHFFPIYLSWSKNLIVPWKKSYGQRRQHIKKQRYYFANKGPSGQAWVFPVVMYGCESWTIKKTEHQRIDAFELWCWRRVLRVSWTARSSN